MSNQSSTTTSVPVWDRFVRIGHWTLVLAFATAYLSAETLEDVHVAAGWWVGGYVVARIIWGFVGTRHARFADFVRPPSAALRYLRDLRRGTATRYLGHNPAGGLMIVALLFSLGGTVLSGLLLQGQQEHEGVFAGLFTDASPGALMAPDGEHEQEDVLEEAHEIFANTCLLLIAVHLLGVLVGSLAHRENLPRAMLSGRKRRLP